MSAENTENAGLSAAELRRLERKKKLLARSEKTDEQLNATLATGNVAELEAVEPKLEPLKTSNGSADGSGASIDGVTREVDAAAQEEPDEHSNLTGASYKGQTADLFEEYKKQLKNEKEYETYVIMKTIVCFVAGILSAVMLHFGEIPGNIFVTLLFADVVLILYFSRAIKKQPLANQPAPQTDQEKLFLRLREWQAKLLLFFELFDDLSSFIIPFLVTMCTLMLISPKGPAVTSEE